MKYMRNSAAAKRQDSLPPTAARISKIQLRESLAACGASIFFDLEQGFVTVFFYRFFLFSCQPRQFGSFFNSSNSVSLSWALCQRRYLPTSGDNLLCSAESDCHLSASGDCVISFSISSNRVAAVSRCFSRVGVIIAR